MRSLKGQLAAALVSFVVVFAIVMVAAWSNLRKEARLYPRQRRTTDFLALLSHDINSYREEKGQLPAHLRDTPWGERNQTSNGEVVDEWNRPIELRSEGNGFVLISLGRDGIPGGTGPDADLFSDGRNREARTPSFLQFMTEWDSSEIMVLGFFLDAFVTGGVVGLTVFRQIRWRARQSQPLFRRAVIIDMVVLVALALFVGIMLLPVHIPNGH